MFAAIGMIVVWIAGLAVFLVVPMVVGMRLSDHRCDDGKAAYIAIPIGIMCGIAYGLVSIIYFVAT